MGTPHGVLLRAGNKQFGQGIRANFGQEIRGNFGQAIRANFGHAIGANVGHTNRAYFWRVKSREFRIVFWKVAA